MRLIANHVTLLLVTTTYVPRQQVPPAALAASASDSTVVQRTRQWIEDVVIRLGLCPYAAKPFQAEQIRYVVSAARTESDLVAAFYKEAAFLLDSSEEEIATSFLLAPHYEEGIDSFYWLYEWLVESLEEAGQMSVEAPPESELALELTVGDRVQPAFFHPQWSFSGVPDDAPIHFEKRAPVPTINLLRRAQLDHVVKIGLDNGVIVNKAISEHNAKALESEGFARLQVCFAKWIPHDSR